MLTQEQFTQLRRQGLTTDQIIKFEGGQKPEQPKKEQGFLKSIASSIIKPFARAGTNLINSAEIALGKKETQPFSGNFLGEVKPIGDTGRGFVADVKDSIGTGAEIASNIIGPSGGVSVVKQGLKGLVKQGLKEGTKFGAITGGSYSLGESLQNAGNSASDVAYDTLFGTALGGLAGGVLGASTPIIARGASNVRKFANVGELENKLASGYKRILNPTARQAKVDARFGNDSFNFLAKELPDLPLTVNKDGRIVADDALEMARQKYQAEATAYKPIIRNSGKYIDIDRAIADAKRVARQEFDGSDLTRAEKQIDDEVNAFLANSPENVNVTTNGKRLITLARADDIKTYSWNRGKGWGSPEAEVWSDTNNLIGHALKDAIEKELPDVRIKAMNKRLGQWKNAIDMLERRNGNVSGSGGKLSKYFIRSLGTAIGSGLGGQDGSLGGGITGATTGFVTAGMIASLMANPNVRLAVVRKLLKNLNKAGRGDMIKEAEQILQQESAKYLLPSAGQNSYIEKEIPATVMPQSAREFNLGLDEVRGNQIPKASQISEPNIPPTKQEIKNSIPETIPEQGGKSIPNKQGGFIKAGSDNSLIQEAKKYKSKEDFVKAQGEPFYHGTETKNIDSINTKGLNASKVGSFGEGYYFENDPTRATRYVTNRVINPKNEASVVDVYLKPDAKIYKYGENKDIDDFIDTYRDKFSSPTSENNRIKDLLESKGYQGVDFYGTLGVFDKNVFSTKPQLTDIYNQAHSKGNLGQVAKSPLAIGAGATGLLAGASKLSQIPRKETITNESKPEVKPEKKTINLPKAVGAIKYNESRGEKEPYYFSQPSGSSTLGKALGAYQITEGELKTYAKRFLGKPVTTKEFLSNPKLQDEYMKEKIRSLAKRGLNLEQILAVHRYGMSDLSKEGLAKTVKKAEGYVKAGISQYGKQ